MYHSHLMIDVGDNPDRPNWNLARKWLRNLYHVHQRLCMAFPSTPVKEEDRVAAYCQPFDRQRYPQQRELSAEADTGEVHQVRNGEAGFLFRIDFPVDAGQRGRRPVILVQSATPPDWDYAFGLTRDTVDKRGHPQGNAAWLLAAPPQVRKVEYALEDDALVLRSWIPGARIVNPASNGPPALERRLYPGDVARFCLRANPTRKVQDGSPNGKRKRVNPTVEDHADWLAGKVAGAVHVPFCFHNFVPGWAYGWRTKYEPESKQRMQWWSVLFEGSFRVNDVALLKVLLERGIGSSKGFGFGLLSVAPAEVTP